MYEENDNENNTKNHNKIKTCSIYVVVKFHDTVCTSTSFLSLQDVIIVFPPPHPALPQPVLDFEILRLLVGFCLENTALRILRSKDLQQN